MTEQEQQDLEVLKKKTQELKLTTWDVLRHILRASPSELITYGYRDKTNAEAMKAAFKLQLDRADKLTREYLKKYPDE